MGDLLAFLIGWGLVIGFGFMILAIIGCFLLEVALMLLYPFSKKVREFHDKIFEINSLWGPWM